MAGFDTVIKMTGGITANTTTNSIVSVDIPENGEILAVACLLTGIYEPSPAVAANIGLELIGELSFLATNQMTTNDSRGTIATIGVSAYTTYSEATETGGGAGKMSESTVITMPEGLIVNAGERIFIHGISNKADLTGTLFFTMYIKAKGGARRETKRR